jgi:peptidoglycan/xylan/chitin deacetylase (PgdA/CDA1 family)
MFDLTLSFDNGPESEVTPAVLNILASHGLRTTFFVIGEKLAQREGRLVAERAWREGHWIGNHSYTHSTPLGLRREPDIAEREIGRTQDVIGALAHPRKFFRPFGGGGNLDRQLLNPRVVDFLASEAYTCVLWNAIPRDWEDPDGWVSRALRLCETQSWTLMVLHDLPTGAMRHLDRFLNAVEEIGGNFRQDFPPTCMPIIEGAAVQALDDYVMPDIPV